MTDMIDWKKYMKPVRRWWKPWTWFKRRPRELVPLSYTTEWKLIPMAEEALLDPELTERIIKRMQAKEDDAFYSGLLRSMCDSYSQIGR